MIYVIESILSILLIAGSAFISYRLFNWAFSTNNIFFMNGAYIAWFVLIFLLVWSNGLAIHKFVENQKGMETFCNIVGIVWALLIIATVIYVWFKRPYSTGSVITRIIWSYFSLGLAAWMYLMINLMQGGK